MNDRWGNRFWGERSVPKSKAEFFNAVTTPAPSGTGTVATIRMYGPIDSYGGFWGISTKDVGQVLDALPESVTQVILRINSPGGEVFEGISILNMLRAHKATVTAVVDGLAASAASVIAAGCDETIMSPGTQMMIHSPWTFTLGNATELRKDADRLDGIESSLIEIYRSKAGDADWTALLAEETWYTAADAVTAHLADRVAVIPDAGETETVGEQEPEIVVVPLDGGDEEDAARMTRIAAFARHQPPNLPSSSEPGPPNEQKEALAMSDTFLAGVRDRLGVTDADASEETVLSALDEALTEQADINGPIPNAIPEGTVLMDAAALDDLKAAAEAGRQARAQQDAERRDRIVASAVSEGRIAPASRETWRAQLDENEEGTAKLIGSLAPNTVPVAELGHSDELSDDDRLYASAWGEKEGA